MKPTPLLTLLLPFLLTATSLAQTESPRLIPFQGRLTDQNGTAYTQGQYTLTFNIYSQAVGGTSAWTERHEKVGVINGMVNVFLGSIQAISSVDFSTTKYLGITIDADNNATTADPEMVPRQMIIPAFHAKNAEKLAGADWSAILEGGSNDPSAAKIAANRLEVNGITALQINSGAVGSDELADGAITGADILNTSIGFEKIAPRALGGVTATVGQIALSPVLSQAMTSTAATVTNSQITLTTRGGPVQLRFNEGALGKPFNNTPEVISMFVYFFRGTTQVAEFEFYLNPTEGYRIPASSLSFVDCNASSGAHTYSVKIYKTASAGNCSLDSARFMAFEL